MGWIKFRDSENLVLMYHGVEKKRNKKFNFRHLGYNDFRSQLQFMKRHFDIVPLSQWKPQRKRGERLQVAITFDDGFINNAKYAIPLLNEFEVSASIYVTRVTETDYPYLWPDFIEIAAFYFKKDVVIEGELYTLKEGRDYINSKTGELLSSAIRKSTSYAFKEAVYQSFIKEGFNVEQYQEDEDNWKLMSDKALLEADQSPFVKIECHSFYHNNLGELSYQAATEELSSAKRGLEKVLGRQVTELAYPDGSYTRELLDFANQIGFEKQLAADGYLFPDDHHDARIIQRVGVYPVFSWYNQLVIAFKGKY